MTLDFDLASFIEDMKACKPPYRCPFKDCGKVYKTFVGINGHILSHDKEDNEQTPSGKKSQRGSSPQPFFKSPVKESLTYNESTKQLEFEAEGRNHKFSIYDALELVDKTSWEASLPQSARPGSAASEATAEETEQTSTPVTASKSSSKKKKYQKALKPSKLESDALNSDAGSDKRPLKLPEAQYSEINDYEIEDAPPMPLSYYRFIEKPPEELDEEVEYDMDEEDVAWLGFINEKREADGLQKIKEDQFELLMDRLEKESYFHVQTNGNDLSAPIDDDAICCVCMDGECSNTNVILFCDLCNLAVHQECYGVPYIPEGQWLCRRCLQSPSRSVECCLCPNKGGAFKQTDDGRWAHVVCGLWIPEVRFANTVFLEPIDSIDNIPPARWKLSCRVCKQRGVGACIQCHKTNCYTAFHVTCGLLAGLHMKMDTVRESSASGLSVTVRKTAYCDVHTPADSDCKPKLDDVAALGINTPKQKKNGNSGANTPKKNNNQETETSPVPVLFRGLMNFSPQCPWEKVQEIAGLISVQRKNQFFQRLMAYWTLKRQTRNGVPLIRRLQFAKAMRSDKAPETPQKNAHHSQKKKEVEKAAAKKAKDEFKAMLEQRKLLRRLRQDLERVRLLCELIRKREQRKRELIVAKSESIELKCWPFNVFLKNVMDSLQTIDTQEIFAEPVSIEDVPDYLDHISKPMDFRTMREKLDGFKYKSFDQMEEDFNLMVENCLSYNERDTVFFRAGVRMRDQGGSIMRQAKRIIEGVGYDPETGLHLDKPIAHVPDKPVSDDKIMKEIDDFLNDEDRDEESQDNLKRLLELQDRAFCIHHPVARQKRLKLLKQEIIKTRRRLSMSKSKKRGRKPKAKKLAQNLDQTSAEERSSSPVLGRRLRTGKETPTPDQITPKPGKRGRKRIRAPSGSNNEDGSGNNQPSKKAKNDSSQDNASQASKSPSKAGSANNLVVAAAASPAKSPAGVNRRNAVLFTRKKQAASTPPASTPDSKSEAKKEASSVGKGTSDSGSSKLINASVESEPKKRGRKKRGRKPKGVGPSMDAPEEANEELKTEDGTAKENGEDEAENKSNWKPPSAPAFQQYRKGGEVGETDEDTLSESATDALVSSEDEDDEDSDEDEDGSEDESCENENRKASTLRIPLEPLDLVWAKCRGYPWYPALIINPKMPRTGYLHNGVPIPVPPEEVLAMAESHTSPHYLILFFDAKRTWQWLTRDKLEPLGVDSELDKAKLVQSKKPSERKAVKKAYEDAILHRCKVTGENVSVSGESSEEDVSAQDE